MDILRLRGGGNSETNANSSDNESGDIYSSRSECPFYLWGTRHFE